MRERPLIEEQRSIANRLSPSGQSKINYKIDLLSGKGYLILMLNYYLLHYLYTAIALAMIIQSVTLIVSDYRKNKPLNSGSMDDEYTPLEEKLLDYSVGASLCIHSKSKDLEEALMENMDLRCKLASALDIDDRFTRDMKKSNDEYWKKKWNAGRANRRDDSVN